MARSFEGSVKLETSSKKPSQVQASASLSWSLQFPDRRDSYEKKQLVAHKTTPALQEKLGPEPFSDSSTTGTTSGKEPSSMQELQGGKARPRDKGREGGRVVDRRDSTKEGQKGDREGKNLPAN